METPGSTAIRLAGRRLIPWMRGGYVLPLCVLICLRGFGQTAVGVPGSNLFGESRTAVRKSIFHTLYDVAAIQTFAQMPDRIRPEADRAADVRRVEPAIQKTLIFEDSFNTENRGMGNLHYRGFAEWLVTKGEVDLVGAGFRYADAEGDLHIDLCGTKYLANESVPGMLRSKNVFDLSPAIYVLEFELACRPEPVEGTLHVQLANAYDEVLALDTWDYCGRFRLLSGKIDVRKSTTGRLSFEYRGQHRGDILLDNIRLWKMPDRAIGAHHRITESNGTRPRDSKGEPDIVSAEAVPAEPPLSLGEIIRTLDGFCSMAVKTQAALLETQAGQNIVDEAGDLDDDRQDGR